MANIRDFWRHGAMRGIESAAARQAIAEARQRWLPILEACARRNEDGVDEHVHAEIRRRRRLLSLPPADPSPGEVDRRRRLVRERVRRFRERQANPRPAVFPESDGS